MQGDADRPPVRISLPQAWLHAAAEAVGATLIALYERVRSGRGQHVDVSAQQASMVAAQAQPLAFPNRTVPPERAGGGSQLGPIRLRFVFRARDGHVVTSLMFGSMVGPYTRRLIEWIFEEGFCDEATRDKDWVSYGMKLLTGQAPLSEYQRIVDAAARFLSTKTKRELFEAALRRKLLIAPVSNAREILEDEHLSARSVWESVRPPIVGDAIRVPGRFAKFSLSPLRSLGRPPMLGEHTTAVLSENSRSPAPSDRSRKIGSLPALTGLKVLDFAWVMAGPLATRTLADNGATIVRIESTERQDLIRGLAPRIDNDLSPESSAPQQNFNAGKLGLALNPGMPAGREVVLDLVRWADVVFDSFGAGAMERWGFDYPALRKINPAVIQVSSSLMGQSGPSAKYSGFGNLAAALSGFTEITGWPDRDPSGPFGAYTDSLAPRFTVIAILAALEYRRRTGQGQFIDLSQAESALHFFTPALLDFQLNGRIATRIGNADPASAPHATYPVSGDDQWIAIGCESDWQWRALCRTMDMETLSSDPKFSSAEKRRANCQEIDEIIAKWTSSRDGAELERKLQWAGVAAHRLERSEDLVHDPQLEHRKHFVKLPHPKHGDVVVEGTRFNLSRTPGRIERPGPMIGEHLQEVLKGILGYDDERIAAMVSTGALE
jgi:crotonobetainyl-CoA:carnitine CoA-transferase CaiB-like acyl-CoA transferase